MLYERPDGESRSTCYRLPDLNRSRRPNNQPANKRGSGELHPEWREHPGDSSGPDRVFGHGHGHGNGRLWQSSPKARNSSGDGYGPVRDLSIRRVRSTVKVYPQSKQRGDGLRPIALFLVSRKPQGIGELTGSSGSAGRRADRDRYRSAVIFQSEDQGAVCFSLGVASSAWITFSNASCGRLPLSRFPLTKNPGVPATPALSPNCRSCSI